MQVAALDGSMPFETRRCAGSRGIALGMAPGRVRYGCAMIHIVFVFMFTFVSLLISISVSISTSVCIRIHVCIDGLNPRKLPRSLRPSTAHGHRSQTFCTSRQLLGDARAYALCGLCCSHACRPTLQHSLCRCFM